LSKGTGDYRAIREKDKILNFLINNIISGKFEFKKGNSYAALAEAFLTNFDSIFVGSSSAPHRLSFTLLNPSVGGTTDIMQTGIFT
jgi:dihydroorotase